MTSVKRMASAN